MANYRKIKPKRVSQQVFEQLRDLIYRGQLKPGDQLLPERKLSEVMGVSRPTVREAINKLVDRGLVENRQGQGTFVRSPANRQHQNLLKAMIDGHDASLMELLEVRLALECNAALLAARRATAEDISALEKCHADMCARIEQGGMGQGFDVQFHMSLAYATANPVQIHIMKNIYDLIQFGIKESMEHLYRNPDNMRALVKQHGKIVEMIRRRDETGALQAMREHLKFVMQAVAKQPSVSLVREVG